MIQLFRLIKLNVCFEIAIRLIFWWLFVWLDRADPFIRHIHPNEVWMYQYPVTPSYIPAIQLWLTIFLFPGIFIGTEYLISRDSDDPIAALMALSLAYSVNGFLTSFIKIIVGRPRPDFYYRCFPQGGGDDFTRCSGIKKLYMDGRKSFPSGHSSFAFTCMVFMSLYMARKFNLFNGIKRGKSWQLCVCITPIIVAVVIAVSRTCDYHHHYEDVACGALLGTAIACLCYKLYLVTNNQNVVSEA